MMPRTVDLQTKVDGLYVGRARQRWAGKPASAIDKRLVEIAQVLGLNGFADDEQADLSVHGGLEKAVHHYAADHYCKWRSELGEPAVGFAPGGFGENISTEGITEADICIGDVLALGSAIVEVSQGRQPCWKLNAHTGVPSMAALFQKTVRTGWYYRVLEAGEVRIGDTIRRLECPNPGWSVERVTRARLDPRLDPQLAATLADLPRLASGWADAFRRKSDRGFREETATRLNAPG